VILLGIVIVVLFIEGIIKLMAFPAAIGIVVYVLYKAAQHRKPR
jgi:hypothetical protein